MLLPRNQNGRHSAPERPRGQISSCHAGPPVISVGLLHAHSTMVVVISTVHPGEISVLFTKLAIPSWGTTSHSFPAACLAGAMRVVRMVHQTKRAQLYLTVKKTKTRPKENTQYITVHKSAPTIRISYVASDGFLLQAMQTAMKLTPENQGFESILVIIDTKKNRCIQYTY